MARPNVPADPPALLPGRSAYEWEGVSIRRLALAFAVGYVIFATAFLPAAIAVVVAHVALVSSFVLFGWGFVSSYHLFVVTMAERAEGYTTLTTGFRAYWQLDPKTGGVLRRPGETRARKRS